MNNLRAVRESHPLHRLFRGLTEYAFMNELGIGDPSLVGYVAGILADFVPSDAVWRVRNRKGQRVNQVTEMIAEAEAVIKRFLETRMYRHARVRRVMDEAAGVVRELFARYSAHPQDLPAEWSDGLFQLDAAARARRIADFIAGMTDRYALAEHARLFDSTPELR